MQLWPGRQVRIRREDKTAEIVSSPDQGQRSIVPEQTLAKTLIESSKVSRVAADL